MKDFEDTKDKLSEKLKDGLEKPLEEIGIELKTVQITGICEKGLSKPALGERVYVIYAENSKIWDVGSEREENELSPYFSIERITNGTHPGVNYCSLCGGPYDFLKEDTIKSLKELEDFESSIPIYCHWCGTTEVLVALPRTKRLVD